MVNFIEVDTIIKSKKGRTLIKVPQITTVRDQGNKTTRVSMITGEKFIVTMPYADFRLHIGQSNFDVSIRSLPTTPNSKI